MTLFAQYKARIIELTKGSDVNLQVAKDKAKTPIIATVSDCKKVLAILEKPKKIKPIVTDRHNWKQRFADAHKLNCMREYKNVWKDDLYSPLKSENYPDVTTHNGLINFMVKYINWSGGNAMSLNVVARVSDKTVTEASGNKFSQRRYTKSSRRGPADVQGTWLGRKIQLDAKVGSDKPRKEQLREQIKERRAGGIYEFIYGTDCFFDIFDALAYG